MTQVKAIEGTGNGMGAEVKEGERRGHGKGSTI